MMDAISACMESLNVDHIRIDGTTKNEMRTVNAYLRLVENTFAICCFLPHTVVVRRTLSTEERVQSGSVVTEVVQRGHYFNCSTAGSVC